MRRFKYYTIMLPYVAIYLIIMILASCKDTHQQTTVNEPSASASLNKSVPKERFENPCKQIGEMHNEAMVAVYSAIKKNSSKIRCIDDLINTAQQGMNEYWWNKKISFDDQSMKKLFKKHDYKRYIISKEKFLKNLSDEGLNNKQLAFIDGFYSLIDKRMSPNDLKDTIAEMNERAVKELGETDAKHVLAVSSIVESSYEYHSKNSREWIELVKNLPIEGKKDNKLSKTSLAEIDLMAVIYADAAAFAGAVINCAESLLFTTYPACVAVYTSVVSATVLLVQCIALIVELLS
ncbi:MAG: hypothetical protein NTX65_01255 [Ignavibacteriales bacterium]|nr:hypothetical protein [Ignavibacteriales bacterium]